MNTYSHILVGNLLYEYIKKKHGISLDRTSFLRGNVAPDYNFSIVTNPHYILNKLSFVEKEINALANTHLESESIEKIYSKRLGVICHFYTDFFCYAHNNPELQQNMSFHIKYERCLHQHLMNISDHLREKKLVLEQELNQDAKEISMHLRMQIAKYLSSKPSYDKDIIFTLRACAGMIISLVNCSIKKSEELSHVSVLKAAMS